MSDAILEEYTRVLNSYEVTSKVDDALLHIATVKRIIARATIAHPANRVSLANDPDDDKFLEAAIEGRADAIISQDRHLLSLRACHGIPIIRPEEFHRLLPKNLQRFGRNE